MKTLRALCVIAWVGLAVSVSSSERPPVAFLEKYCLDCHDSDTAKGELNLERLLSGEVIQHAAEWETVIRRLSARQMPPSRRKRRPSESEYAVAVSRLAKPLDRLARREPNPGRVPTFRRLTRTEYQNAIRDLLGVQIDATQLLPKDEESHGFDNITVGSLSPSLLDRFLTAAQKISWLAFGTPVGRPDGFTFRLPADFTQEKHVAGLPVGTRGGMLLPYMFPRDGEYEIQVRLARDRNEHVEGLRGTHKMDLLMDRALLKQFTVTRPKSGNHDNVDKHLVLRQFVKAGVRNVGVTFPARSVSLLETKRQPTEARFNVFRHPRQSPAVYQVSITGPFGKGQAGLTPSRKKIFFVQPSHPKKADAVAEDILNRLMKLAYRREVTEDDLASVMRFYLDAAEQGGFEVGIAAGVEAILVNPSFLFRVEKPPADPEGKAYRISEVDLASRLSFFLWSSLPDEELLDLAIAGRLQQPGVLEKQVQRLLADQRADSLVTNFASQWLHLRNLDAITPDLRLFPDFDENLRRAFRRETELFFESILHEDLSALELLNANYTFLNERLAKHYGVPHVFGSRFRRVVLKPDNQRGGLLRHGSILSVTSYATRTSPVIRGHWVLENFLGTPSAPPPSDVPVLKENKVEADLPMRERLAKHRENAACASCHDRIDPVGFALENFDAIGRWREFEHGARIDASGGLPDGAKFDGVAELEQGLLNRPELFVRTLTEKLMTFALGRGVESIDAPAIRQIVADARADDFRLSSLLLGITKSIPFRMKAGVEQP
ncbi:MAG: DUF1592 domain-containing protein [Verrucomicrobiota bacterium]|nr:DUF1592 domain-containing protein [Verrucomicrobiota bacterium]